MTVEQAASRNNVLIITGDPLGKRMAGPAIRALNFAEQLATVHDVRLITTNLCELERPDFEIERVPEHSDLRNHEEWADVIIVQGNILSVFPKLQRTQKYLVCDLYDPMHLEQLEQGKDPSISLWNRRIGAANHLLNTQLLLGDFFLAASERQRDFWLGALASLGRINAHVYAADNTLQNLLAVAPFGLSDTPPQRSQDPLRGRVPGIEPGDKIVIWAGGIYNWFDPETLVLAMAALAERHDDVKLFFMGTQHPHPGVPEMDVLRRSRLIADELGLSGRTVFFNSEWVPFHDRQNFLLSADLGVSTHFEHVETRFSFRTRILDYLWAELPIVTTRGDTFADLVEERDLGIVVGERNETELAAALERLLFDSDFHSACKSNVRVAREAFFWSETAKPLLQFCWSPEYAADRSFTDREGKSRRVPSAKTRGPLRRLRQRFLFLIVSIRRDGLINFLVKIPKKFGIRRITKP